MFSVGAMESRAIFGQFPAFFAQFEKFQCHLLERVSAAGMNMLVSLMETIKRMKSMH